MSNDSVFQLSDVDRIGYKDVAVGRDREAELIQSNKHLISRASEFSDGEVIPMLSV